jgi:mannosyltransferase
VSQYVAAHSNPGDAILFDETVRNSRLPRLAMRMYPQDYRGLSDVELVTPFYDTSGLWDKTAPLDRVAPKLATTRTVLLLELRGSRDRVTADDVDSLESLGYELKNEKTVNRTFVYIMTRGTS